MTSEILKMSLSEVSKQIKNRSVSPVDVVKAAIDEVKNRDVEINSFITLTEDKAIEEAQVAESSIQKGIYKGPLHGIPIGLKDLINVKGVPTTVGSEIYKDYIPNEDAEIVNKLRNSGAINLGKLNMHQFAYGTTGDRSFFGPVKNPHDPTRVTGGSSAGSGAAVAANFIYGSIGSDTGGSIRIPASCCGIVGMKPTFGIVSKRGAFPLCWTLDHLGPMTRTVKDNALMLNAIVGHDSQDPYSIKTKDEDYTKDIGKSLKGLTIGIPKNFYFDIIQDEVYLSFKQTVQDIENCGVTVEYIEIPHMEELLTAQQVILTAEAFSVLEKDFRQQPERIEEELRSRIALGMGVSASDYLQALKIKNLAISTFTKLFNDVDIFMTPTLPALPDLIDNREIDVQGNKEHPKLYNRLTGPMNTTGFPALSVPGLPVGKIPVGIQFFGAPFSEKLLYRMGSAVESLYIQKQKQSINHFL
ncbi:amidase [Bacillus sp. ISL-47]|uniref:amidase n=1 Tax=Bacillus sp. ISL-47 TaxID=2819130 RepID=UPI001BE748A1|nr:amidase [Bacillus sp. ISL-47]MBT2686795.1 amidase [Bacillus sp. ISL-47]MBT2706852.1 amidase [Pseudomonas sp. ISL-84]